MIKNSSIALHAICKNEDYYIEEWIDYHSRIGIDYFILYDNNSDTSLKEQLTNYKNVKVIKWKDSYSATQLRSQKHCIIHNQNFRWIGFLDIDEYVVLLNDSTNLKEYMLEFEAYDGLGLYWLAFGANEHKHRQASTILSYTQSCPSLIAFNKHIKCFINPQKYIGNHWTSHYLPVNGNFVDVSHQDISSNWLSRQHFRTYIKDNNQKSILNDKMRINHYHTRSLEDFQHKMKRGGGISVNKVYTMDGYKHLNYENIYNDDIIKTLRKIEDKK